MSEYIKREDALDMHFSVGLQDDSILYVRYAEVKDNIKHIPTADVVKVKHAYDMDEYTSLFECSNCGWMCDDTYCGNPCVGNTVTYNYCPNCGAKIDYKIGYGERKDGESNE